jgi:hypothetical protein
MLSRSRFILLSLVYWVAAILVLGLVLANHGRCQLGVEACLQAQPGITRTGFTGVAILYVGLVLALRSKLR